MLPSRFLLRRTALSSLWSPITRSARRYQSSQPPSSSSAPTTKQFYGTFGSPFFKVFLGALFTYQVLYYGWLRLEKNEYELEKSAEIRELEGEVRSLTGTEVGEGRDKGNGA